jgi:hypothetical protein
MRTLFVLWIAGCGGAQEPQPQPTQLECTIDGQTEKRVMRDCSSDLSYQERDVSAKVEAFGVQLGGGSNPEFRPIQNSVNLLLEQQRGMCRDWNACALSRQEYVQRSEWLTSQFTTLQQLLDAASPETMNDPAARERVLQQILDWAQRAQELRVTERIETQRNEIAAEQVAVDAQGNEIQAERAGFEAEAAMARTDQAGSQNRQASAEEEQARLQREMMQRQAATQSGINAQNAEVRASQRAQFQVQIENLERQARDLEAFLPTISRMRSESAGLAQGKRPRFCASNLRASLETAGRGENQHVADTARRMVDQIERSCTPFDLWEHPNADVLRELGRIPQSLESDERMASERTSEPADVKARVVAKIQEARRAVAGTETGARPFPCAARVWQEILDLSNSGNGWLNTAAERAVRNRDRVCQTIGVLPRSLEQNATTLASILDGIEGPMRQNARSFHDAADRFRASIPPE